MELRTIAGIPNPPPLNDAQLAVLAVSLLALSIIAALEILDKAKGKTILEFILLANMNKFKWFCVSLAALPIALLLSPIFIVKKTCVYLASKFKS